MHFEEYLRYVYPEKLSRVQEAELYSLLAGGKRVRPNIHFAVLEGYGISKEEGYPIAAAIEMIHTYSLIHDDLPSMDNDDFRRGKLTCHKMFDEATAILAGDGLLTRAFETITKANCKHMGLLVSTLAKASGDEGMILGQELDITLEHAKDVTIEQLKQIHNNKTGQLLAVPMTTAAILADHLEDVPVLFEVGTLLGLAFQIQDDIFDVTKSNEEMGKSCSDFENGKTTYVSVLGLKKAQELLETTFNMVLDRVHSLPMNVQPLLEMIDIIIKREK